MDFRRDFDEENSGFNVLVWIFALVFVLLILIKFNFFSILTSGDSVERIETKIINSAEECWRTFK